MSDAFSRHNFREWSFEGTAHDFVTEYFLGK